MQFKVLTGSLESMRDIRKISDPSIHEHRLDVLHRNEFCVLSHHNKIDLV